MRPYLIFLFILILVVSSYRNKTSADWTDHDKFYQVYSFSEKVMGLTIELGHTTTTQNPFIDAAFDKFSAQDSIWYVISQPVKTCILVDTSYEFQFYKHEDLSNYLMANIDKDFFVYCTKGIVKRTIKDAVFALDECKSNVVVFRFDPIDTVKYGQPIFCSKQKLSLTFGENLLLDKSVSKYISNLQSDYSDSMQSKTFAYSDTLICTYSDNFNWNLSSNSECLFPSRVIFTKSLHTDTIYIKWANGLDLLGIPCD